MFKNRDKSILSIALIVAIIIIPLSFFKEPRKDWLIVFFLKAFISSIIAGVTVSYKWLEFPVRLLPKIYNSSLLFDYLYFPLPCVWYNQTTYTSKLKGILLQVFLVYSPAITLLEYWLEKNTNVIKYNKWTWFHTYVSLSFTFLLVRGFMYVIRKISKSNKDMNQEQKLTHKRSVAHKQTKYNDVDGLNYEQL